MSGNEMHYKFPWFSFEFRIHKLYKRFVYKRRFRHFGEKSFLSPYSEIYNMHRIHIGDRVTIYRGALMIATEEYAGTRYSPLIEIGNNAYIGRQVTLSCVNSIKIGDDVTFGDNVYIADCTHSYEDLKTQVIRQPLKSGRIVIGNNVWIGKNTVIAYDLEIGEYSVIGANSLVNRSVPPYTVVAGNPAKPVKQYDFGKQQWIRVGIPSPDLSPEGR